MTSETITAGELAEIMGVAKTTILRRLEKIKTPYVTGERGVKQFYTASLPEDVKLAVARRLASDFPLVPDASPAPGGNAGRVPVGSPDLAGWQNRTALARMDLVRAYQAEKSRAKKAGRSVTEAARTFVAGYNTGRLYPNIYSVLSATSFQTVEKWLKDLRSSNWDYAALAPRWGNRRGQSKITDEELNTALSFALHPNRLNIQQITRLAKMALQRRAIPSPSSDATIRRALAYWKKTHYDLWVFCREGEKALNDKVLPYLERDAGLLDVGEVLVADGHTLNFEVLHPDTGRPRRMTMVLWYDWASRMPLGWEIMPSENVQCVASGLRRAILNLGRMPKVAYLDNGKAFKARVFTDQAIDFEEAGFYGMFARLGIETIFAWPYNAQSKPVERFFGSFSELERLTPTFSGTSITDKPARMLRNEKLHKRLHEKRYGGWVPSIEEANRIVAGWVMEYAARPHRGLKGLKPGEVFKSGRGPGVDERALRHLMLTMEVKSIHRNGVTVHGVNYYDEALYGYRDRVTVKYDLQAPDSVLVYDQSGAKMICEARAVRPVHPVARLTGDQAEMDKVQAGIVQKRSLKKYTERDARAAIEFAPDLITLPDYTADGGKNTPAPDRTITRLPRAEAERIEAEAGRMVVIEIAPAPKIYATETERYEALLEQECRALAGGGDNPLSLDDMQFMRYFERTALYRSLRDGFDNLREYWLAGGESAAGRD